MVSGNQILVASLFAAVSFLTAQSTSRAALAGTIFTETTDAGQTLATANSTAAGTAGTPLTEIVGSFNSATDADLYAITFTSPSTFTATTNNTATNLGGLDTELFLFSATGAPIAVNDDAAGGMTTNSTLPAGNGLYANLAAGTYYIGISESDNEAINSSGQQLFAPYPGGDTTAVRGAMGLLNPATLATFNGSAAGGGTGGYEIDLTSVATAFNPNAVPEPSTWAACALGGIVAGFTILRRRRSA